MQLEELLRSLKVKRVIGDTRLNVTGFAMDSRKVKPGNMFVVLTEPELDDRTKYIAPAVEAGATSVLIDHEHPGVPGGVTQIIVPETQVASAYMAARFYGNPGERLALLGVTGTKGKTTTSYLIAHLLQGCGIKVGVIGTTGARFGTIDEPTNTTPHAIELQRILGGMADQGAQAVSMEASSHALRLHRTAGLRLAVGVFTNIGSDHLNFHRDIEDYIQAKSMLMSKVTQGVAVINCDDPRADLIRRAAACEVLTYGLSSNAMLRATDIRYVSAGTQFRLVTPWGEHEAHTQLFGQFNVYNCLAALGAVIGYGADLEQALAALPSFPGVPGRMESVDAQSLGLRVIVDYAHTPESMDNVLETLKAANPRRIITVFGAGGDRDRTRRPRMAVVAAKYSDYTLVTSDNPRTEDPLQILNDIEQGFVANGVDRSRYEVDPDRRSAIYKAIEMAGPGDIVAILGKGHETYQEINHVRYPFDDREVAREAIQARTRHSQS